MSESLRKLIEPHFLRRTKAMVLENNKTETDGVDKSVESEKGTSLNYSSKYDICCHTYVLVHNIYNLIIHSTQAWVWKEDNSIHQVNHYPIDSLICFVHTYTLQSDLSGG